MADQEQLARLKRSVKEWNQWCSKNLQQLIDLRGADLIGADLRGANLVGADLEEVNLLAANLVGANLARANLARAHLVGANLARANLARANLVGADLFRAYLVRANLEEAYLEDVNLSEVDLLAANLAGANLARAQVLVTNCQVATFTGACLQDWNTNRLTNLTGVKADYIYLGNDGTEFTDRRPYSGNFKPGEFAALFQHALDTIDLIFVDGIDWQAFFTSFQDLRQRYGDADLNIQAIEKKSGGSFVVRLEVPEEADKAAIEQSVKAGYEQQLQLSEARYQAQLQAKDAEIKETELASYRRERENERQQNARVDKLVEILSEHERSKMPFHPNQLKILRAIDEGLNISHQIADAVGLSPHQVCYYVESLEAEQYLKYSEVSDGISRDPHYLCSLTAKGRVAAEDPSLLMPTSLNPIQMNTINNNNMQGANIGNFANQANDNASMNATQNIYAAEAKTPAEAAQEIHDLLVQLAQDNPLATDDDRAEHLRNTLPPNRLQRSIELLQTAGEAAVESLPGGKVITAVLKKVREQEATQRQAQDEN